MVVFSIVRDTLQGFTDVSLPTHRAVLIVVGLGAFVVARNDAIKKRQDQMRYRKALKEQVIREQEASKDN